MKTPLTVSEIIEIERNIEAIDTALSILDPSNPIEAQEVERIVFALESFISLLERDSSSPFLKVIN